MSNWGKYNTYGEEVFICLNLPTLLQLSGLCRLQKKHQGFFFPQENGRLVGEEFFCTSTTGLFVFSFFTGMRVTVSLSKLRGNIELM